MPKELQIEAIDYAIYLSNRFPPSYVWEHSISTCTRSREVQANKSKNYVFICYDPSSNGYKLKNLNIGKLIVNRDVEFNEEGI